MAKEDIVVKEYMSDKVIFSDFINGSIFHGNQIVKPEHLTELRGESDLYLTGKNNKKKSVMRYRDVIMKADFAIFAEENQMNVHYAMPVRNMLYDALSYTEQIENIRKEHEQNGEKLLGAEFLSGMRKEDKIIPVITMVIYYGEREWDGSLDLYEMMGMDDSVSEELKEVLPNYRINLLHAGNIENLENYKSSLQLVFGMLKYKSNKAKLREYMEQNREKLESIDEAAYRVIGVLLHEEKRLEKYRKKAKGEMGMCKAIDEMIADGKIEGRDEERLRIAKELKGILSDEVIAEKTGLPLKVIEEL